MHNLLRLILRYSHFIVFVLLEAVAIVLIVRNNAYPRSSVFSTANRVVAWHYQITDEIGNYFRLRTENEVLAAENTALRNRLNEIENRVEALPVDTAGPDTVYRLAQYDIRYIPAKAVQTTTNQPHNYLTINKGARDGIRVGMGVRNHEGVVGIVRTVSTKYAVVLPIIHTNSHLSCRFAKNDYIGTLQWDGRDARFASLTDVASHMVVNPGDTIVTSGLSPAFPAEIPVGIVENSRLEEGDSYYTIRVRLATNFRRLKYVEVIDNENAQELETLTDGMD